jgi:hypothetical protein
MPHYSSIVTDITSCRPTATPSCDQLPCSILATPNFSDSHHPTPCYTSSSLNINLFFFFVFYIFFISCIEPAVHIFLLLFCICCFTGHRQCQIFFIELMATMFPWSILHKRTINEHSLSNRIHSIHTHTHTHTHIGHLLFLTHNPCPRAHLTHSADIRKTISAGSLKKTEFIFSYAWGHD